MSIIREINKEMNCSVCGKYIEIEEYKTISYGCCDEDWPNYPPEWAMKILYRKTFLNTVIKYEKLYVCPNCGYCNINLENKFKKTDVIYNENYQKETNKYIKYFMLLRENKFYIKAMKYLFAAYKEYSDDKEKTLNLMNDYYNFLESFIKQERLFFIKLILIDIFRKNKKFDLALKFCNKEFPKKYKPIIDFQKKLIEFEDYDEYNVDDIEIICNNCKPLPLSLYKPSKKFFFEIPLI
jgi:hypothetical protein